MNPLFLGNAIALIGASIMVVSGLIKKKRQIVLVQCIQFTLQGISNLILGGVTGFISGMASVVRNVISLRVEFTLPYKLAFIGLQIVLTYFFNTGGSLGLIPPVSTCLFTWFLDTKSETVLKTVIIITMFMWIVYDWSIQNYVSFAFDIGTVVSNVIGILALRKARTSA